MSGETMGVHDARHRITELVRAARIGTLTTICLDGRPVARPMTLQRAEFDGRLWFFAYAASAAVRQLRVNPEVEVGLHDPGAQVWASISGSARDEPDPGRAERLWHPGLAAWFPGGPATPGLTLITVHVTAARCWDARGAQVDLTGRPAGPPGGDRADGYWPVAGRAVWRNRRRLQFVGTARPGPATVPRSALTHILGLDRA